MASRHEVFGMMVERGDPAVNLLKYVFYCGMDNDGAQMGEEEITFNQVSCDRIENAHDCSVSSNNQDGWGKLQG